MADKKWSLSLSAYERRARLVPGLLAVAPVTITVITLGLKAYPAVALSLGVLTAAGGAYLLSVIVGNAGRRIQDDIFKAWGGRPTTQLLRTRNSDVNPAQREIWRTAIEAATGVKLLSKRRELSDPAMADYTIEAATDQMRHLTDDERFPRVAAENAAYGFERNLWGFRWFGRSIAFLCLLVTAGFFLLPQTDRGVTPEALVIGIVIDGILLAIWIGLPSSKRAREAGLRYAQQLMQAVTQQQRDLTNSTDSKDGGAAPQKEN